MMKKAVIFWTLMLMILFCLASSCQAWTCGTPLWLDEGNSSYDDSGYTFTSDPLEVYSQSEDYIMTSSNNAFFWVTATGGKSPYKYQWQVQYGGSGQWANLYSGDGYNESFLTVAYSEGARYRCQITDTNGRTVTSSPVTAKRRNVSSTQTSSASNAYSSASRQYSSSTQLPQSAQPAQSKQAQSNQANQSTDITFTVSLRTLLELAGVALIAWLLYSHHQKNKT